MTDISIIVGTVHGTSLLIAKKIKPVLIKKGHKVNIFYKNIKKLETYINKTILIVTSTTGNGDVPENIVPFLQKIKNREICHYVHQYGIIALGDSSYSKFCNAGHTFDNFLQKLNIKRVGSILEIDDMEHYNPEIISYKWAEIWGSIIRE